MNRLICYTVAFFVLTYCTQAQTKKKAEAKPRPAAHIFHLEGNLAISRDMAETSDEARLLIQQIGGDALPGGPLDVPGLRVKMIAAADRALEGTTGDIILVDMLINYLNAKRANAKIEEFIATYGKGEAGRSKSRLNGGQLYELEHAVLDPDPAETNLIRRQNACDSAIREMIDTLQARTHVLECESAELDPRQPKWPLETVDVTLQPALVTGSKVSEPCRFVAQDAIYRVDRIFVSRAGVLGKGIATEQIENATFFCTSEGELRVIAALRGMLTLKSRDEMLARYEVLEKYLKRPFAFPTAGDFEALIKQSWAEEERAPSVAAAHAKVTACSDEISAALQSGIAEADIDLCKVH